METKVLKIDPIRPDNLAIREAAGYIANGGLVVFPTETVYGIGADAFNSEACRKIFKAKGRPSDNPLIVTVASLEQAQEIGKIPEERLRAIRRMWPCPLTFIVDANRELPREVTAGLNTVALRMPAHPVALELIKAAGVPIAAPSANLSKKPTSTNAQQALRYFDGKVDCIVDSGPSFFGLESTIIDLRTFTVLRPGPFTIEELEKAFGERPKVGDVAKGMREVDIALSPGTKYKHYAPDTPLFMFDGNADELLDIISEIDEIPEFVFVGSAESCKKLSETGCSTIALGTSKDLYEIAKNLYDGLILIDSMKVKFGVVEIFNEEGIGLAIMNRIRKASSHNEFKDTEGLRGLIAEAPKPKQDSTI